MKVNFIQKNNSHKRGFTLLEMLVAVTLFTIITTMSIGSLVTVFDANRKTQSLRTVMENLNFTMEGMSREIKFGTEYYCRDSSEIQTLASISSMETARSTAGAGAGDCSDKNAIAFKSQTGHYLRYTFDSANGSGLIEQSIDGAPFTSITAPEIDITRLAFFVLGSSSEPTDKFQPRTTISISGHTGLPGSNTNIDSSFNIQTTVSQRALDQN
jgi:prepilin-type N-terminal cleavage/methylation domain-containing protein